MSLVATSLSRAALLRGRIAQAPAGPRPPWALAEPAFAERCDGCGDCLGVCAPKILVRDRAGRAAVDFSRGACTFCGACADACPTGALVPAIADPCTAGTSDSGYQSNESVPVRADDSRPWTLHASITGACLSARGTACRACEDACDESAVRFRPLTRGRALPVIRMEACTGCGACVAPCPVAAIRIVPASEGVA